MSDELDHLEVQQQIVLEQQINVARNSVTDRLVLTGFCHYCDESVGEKKFCDEYCSQDWHNERAARFRKHGVHHTPDE